MHAMPPSNWWMTLCDAGQKQLWAEHASYAAHNPDLRALLSDFLQHLLIDKPADVLDFCAQYFDAFSAGCGTVPEACGSGRGGSGMAGRDGDDPDMAAVGGVGSGVEQLVPFQGSEVRRMTQEQGYEYEWVCWRLMLQWRTQWGNCSLPYELCDEILWRLFQSYCSFINRCSLPPKYCNWLQ